VNPLDTLMAKQLSRPTGLLGQLVGRSMTRDNRRLIEWTSELLSIQSTDNVLEVGFGCGVGIQRAAALASRGRVAGIELSEAMLKEARRLNAAAIAEGRVDLAQGNVTSLPFADDTFDEVFAVNVHYFWEDPLAALREIRRVLKPGGRMALGFVDEQGMRSQGYTHTGVFTLYSSDELIEVLRKAGFSQPRVEVKQVHRVGLGQCVIAES
jgi:ubiquinone/menaquinone biosynthesis C-methylase UbiE